MVPVPVPFTSILPAHVPPNVTLADVSVTGVTVYFTPPQLVAGRDEDDVTQVPAKSPAEAEVELGAVGSFPLNLSIKLHAAVNAHTAARPATSRDGFPIRCRIGGLRTGQ
jgi:hypothetical protein